MPPKSQFHHCAQDTPEEATAPEEESKIPAKKHRVDNIALIQENFTIPWEENATYLSSIVPWAEKSVSIHAQYQNTAMDPTLTGLPTFSQVQVQESANVMIAVWDVYCGAVSMKLLTPIISCYF